jgi:hypothetical protein
MASHAFPSIKSTTHPNLQAELCYDPHPEQPELFGHITYNSRAKYILGTKPLDAEQDAAIAEGVRKGKLIGLPVWAYVHGSTTLRAAYDNPFGCPWDSGRSGWVYISTADARSYLNVKRLTKANRTHILRLLEQDVKDFSAYLNSECYGFIIRNTDTDETLDSCWGYYGESAVRADAESALKQMEAITPCQLELVFTEGE